MTETRSAQRPASTPRWRAPRDPALRAGSWRWWGAALAIGVAGGTGLSAACGAPPLTRSAAAILPVVSPWPLLKADGRLQEATLLAAAARLHRQADGVCVVEALANDGAARIEAPCDTTFPTEPVEVSPVALRISRRTGTDTPSLIEVFRADEGFLRDSFGARLVVAARGAPLPVRLGTDVRLELGGGPDQRVASEVVSRADGCAFAYSHGRIGLVDRERLTWAAAGEAVALSVEGVDMSFAVHAVALPARQDGSCEAEAALGATLLRRFADWPRPAPTLDPAGARDDEVGLRPSPPPPP